jgi:hypothetical protein
MYQPNGVRPYLVWRGGANEGRNISLDQDFTVIGRDPSCGVTIDGEDVASRHATLEISSTGGATLVDLASFSGTYVNGEAVTRRVLSDGDRIHFGKGGELCLTFHTMAAAASPKEAGELGSPDYSPVAVKAVVCESCGEVIDSDESLVDFCPFCGNQQGQNPADGAAAPAEVGGMVDGGYATTASAPQGLSPKSDPCPEVEVVSQPTVAADGPPRDLPRRPAARSGAVG